MNSASSALGCTPEGPVGDWITDPTNSRNSLPLASANTRYHKIKVTTTDGGYCIFLIFVQFHKHLSSLVPRQHIYRHETSGPPSTSASQGGQRESAGREGGGGEYCHPALPFTQSSSPGARTCSRRPPPTRIRIRKRSISRVV